MHEDRTMKRLLLFVAFLAWSSMAGAAVYKWIDAQGKLQYGDRPPDGVRAELVELLGVHTARVASAKPSGAPAAKTPGRDQPNQNDAVKKAVDSDVAQVREKQCADAQDRYKKLIEGRRLYKTGPDGQRQYLTSEEIDSERLNAKRDVDDTCGGST
jgi:Domain of unknown function (DUF4124)